MQFIKSGLSQRDFLVRRLCPAPADPVPADKAGLRRRPGLHLGQGLGPSSSV